MMLELIASDFIYLGACLEGLFYGLYTGIFAMYLQCHWHAPHRCPDEKKISFSMLSVFYMLYLGLLLLVILL